MKEDQKQKVVTMEEFYGRPKGSFREALKEQTAKEATQFYRPLPKELFQEKPQVASSKSRCVV